MCASQVCADKCLLFSQMFDCHEIHIEYVTTPVSQNEYTQLFPIKSKLLNQ